MKLVPVSLRGGLFLSLFALLFSCKTQDVYPTLTLRASTANLNENGGTMQIIARLNGPTAEAITVPLTFTGNTVLNRNFSVSAALITINAGVDSGFITLTAIATTDTGSKTIIIGLGETANVLPQPPLSVVVNLVNANADRDADGIPDISDACPDNFGPIENDGCPWLGLLVNEVLYDPADGLAGDANGDGIREAQGDEFVEFYNSNPILDISGYTISDADAVRHTFPANTIIPSKGVVVVFGGGTPTGTFGGAVVQTASTGLLNLNNAGDMLTLRDTQGNVVAIFDINGLSGNPDEAYTRNPDITGAFVQHASIPAANGAFFSPGKRVNGSNF